MQVKRRLNVLVSLSNVLANRNYSMTWPYPFSTIEPKLDIAGHYLVVSHFNQGLLVVSRGLNSMEVHHSCGYVGEPRGFNVVPEFHSGVKTRASNGNRDLQVLQRH